MALPVYVQSSFAALDIVTTKDGRVLLTTTNGDNGYPDTAISFTYKNLIDDNCDGK